MMNDSLFRRLVALFTAYSLVGSNIVWATQIVTDGMTRTHVDTVNNITNISTETVHGLNAFNSFATFNVQQSHTVNLHLPSRASNLVNLVHEGASRIDGTLNAYKSGRIGGNVFFANPHGIVVGSQGMVNVGALTAVTPTQEFMRGFFDGAGNPSAHATEQLLDGSLPINPNGLISVQGQINAIDEVHINAGRVDLSGRVVTGPGFSASEAGFSELVNSDGLENATAAVERNGEIFILGQGDVSVTGQLLAEGANGVDGGRIEVRAGQDIRVEGEAVLSTRGQGIDSDGGEVIVLADRDAVLGGQARLDASGGLSGDGGFVEFSAKETVELAGGQLLATAEQGVAGTVLIDPENITLSTSLLRASSDSQPAQEGASWDAGSLVLEADNKITVMDSVVVSTRDVEVSGEQSDRDAHVNNISMGDSGNLTLSAKEIELKTGAKLLTYATDTYQAGEIKLNAKQINLTSAELLANNPDDAAKSGNIELNAIDDAVTPVFGSFDNQEAKIELNGTDLKGKAISLIASADDEFEYSGNSAIDTPLSFLDNLMLFVDVTVSTAKASIDLYRDSQITASGAVKIEATANADASMDIFGTGLAVGYGQATSMAKINISDADITSEESITLTTNSNNTINLSALALNFGNLNPLPVDANKYIEFGLGIVVGDLDSTIDVGKASSLTANNAGAIDINALGTKDTKLSVAGSNYDDGVSGVAIGYTEFDSDVISRVDGSVDGGDISIDSDLIVVDNGAAIASGVGRDAIAAYLVKKIQNTRAAQLAQKANSALFSKLSAKLLAKTYKTGGSKSTAKNLGLSASVLWLDHENTVRASVGDNGVVDAGGTLHIGANTIDTGFDKATEQLTYRVFSGVDKALIDGEPETKKYGLAASVALVDLAHDAEAYIDHGADVDADGTITIKAIADVPMPALRWRDWAVEFWTGDKNDFWHYFDSGKTLLLDLLLDPTLSLMTGLVKSSAESEYALTGAFDFYTLDNRAQAWIADSAKVNQEVGTSAGDVTVSAKASYGSVHVGNESLGGGASGIGGTYQEFTVTGGADASIGSAALVKAQNLNVSALSDNFNLNVAVAGLGFTGNKGGGVASLTGAVSWINSTTETTAQIASGATVEADEVVLDATDNTYIYNAAGALARSVNGAVGASVSINEMQRQVRAIAGERPSGDGDTLLTGDQAMGIHVGTGNDGSITSAGKVDIKAASNGHLGSYSLAAAATGKAGGNPDLSGAKTTGKGRAGIGVSGDVSINQITDTTESIVNDGMEVIAKDDQQLLLSAKNSSSMSNFSGAVTIGGNSLGIAGSYSDNQIKKLTHATLSGGTLTSEGDVKLETENSGTIVAITASGSGAKGTDGIQLVGQYAENRVENESEATIVSGKVTADSDDNSDSILELDAQDSSKIYAVAGALSYGGSAGIGVSYANNIVKNKTRAYLKQSEIGADDKLILAAWNGNEINNIAATFGIAAGDTALTGAGSISTNEIANETEAYIDNSEATETAKRQVNADSIIKLKAHDNSTISVIAGGAAFGGKGTVGVSVATNLVNNTVKAYANDLIVDDTGSDVTIKAVNESDINALAGAVGVNLTSVGAGAAVSINRINGPTEAYLTGEESDLKIQELVVKAESDREIDNITVGIGGGNKVGVGGSVTTNILNHDTTAYINGGADVEAEHNVGVIADSNDRIMLAAGTGGIGLSGAGVGASINVNYLTGNTKAYIEGSDTLVTAKANDASSTLSVADGTLDSEVDLGKQVDLGTYAQLDLKSKKNTHTVTGVAVNASATQQVEVIAVNGAGSKDIAVGLVQNYDLIGGSTEAYIDGAQINTLGTSAADQSVDVVASNHAYANNFLGNIAVGTGAVGVGYDGSSITRSTKAYLSGGKVNAKDLVRVNAFSNKGISSLAVGGSAGISGGVGIAGTVVVSLFKDTASAYVSGTDLDTKDLEVKAESDNNQHLIGGTLGGGVSGGGSGTFVVSSSNTTTEAYIEDASGTNWLDASGAITVSADTDTHITHYAISGALAGGVGIAGMASLNFISNTTEATVRNSQIGAAGDQVASLSLSASDTLELLQGSGALGVGIKAGGIGAGGNLGMSRSRTIASIDDSTVHASGAVDLSADSEKTLNSYAFTAGGGKTFGIGVGAAILLVGDNVSGDAEAELNSSENGTLSAVDGFINADRSDEGNGEDDGLTDDERTAVNAGTDTDVVSAADGTHPGTLQYRTATEVLNSSVINAGSIDMAANDRVRANSVVGGFGGGIVALGGGVGITNVKANVNASIDTDSTITTTDGLVKLTALADSAPDANDNDQEAVKMVAIAGGAGVVGLGAAVALADINNNVVAEAGGKIGTGSGKLELLAEDKMDMDIQADGVTIGAAAVGAVVSRATKTSTVTARTMSRTHVAGDETDDITASGGIDVTAKGEGKVRAYTMSAAGGILAGAGSAARATDTSTVQAYTASTSRLNTGSNALKLLAQVQPEAEAIAGGYGGALLINVGVSIAEAIISPTAKAFIGQANRITAGSVDLDAIQQRNGDEESAFAKAEVAGGALGDGIIATTSNAKNTSVVHSAIGDNSDLTVTNGITVDADVDSYQSADVDGYTAGLVGAVGSNYAKAESNTTVKSWLGGGVALTAQSLSIVAGGVDENYADSRSGQGALLIGSAASSAITDNTSTTHADIGVGTAGRLIQVDDLTLTADHKAKYNAKANSDNGGLIGLSGARTENTVDSTVQTAIAGDVEIEAVNLTAKAINRSDKPFLDSDAVNVRSSSGGFYDGPAIKSATTITHDTALKIGSGAKITVAADPATPNTPGTFNLLAFNDLLAQDKVKLDSGGAIPMARGESTIDNEVNRALVDIGANAELMTDGDMVVSTRAKAEIDTVAHVSTYGVAGSGTGKSESKINVDNDINIGAGALLRSGGQMKLLAGIDDTTGDNAGNNLDADAETRLWNNTVVPFTTSPEAKGEIDQDNKITVNDNAQVLSVADVTLTASSGTTETRGYGKGTDLWRQAGEEVVNFFGGLVGADEVSFDIEGGSTSDEALNGVEIKSGAEVRAGVQSHQYITFAADGTVALDGLGNPIQSDGVTYTLNRNVSLTNNLQTRIDDLRALETEYADTPDVAAAFKAEADYLVLKLADMGGSNVIVDYLEIDDIYARSGDVLINGDYLVGAGLIEAPGDTRIDVINQSGKFMSLQKLEIGDEQGGHILFNDAPVTAMAEIIERSVSGQGDTTLNLISAATSAEPEINVLSTNTLADPLAGIDLLGDITNNRGSVNVYGEGDVTASASITANSISLTAGRDVMLGYVQGFRHTGGDPVTHSPFYSLASTSESDFTEDRGEDPASEVAVGNGILAGNNIFVSGERLNINTTLESGRPYRTLTITSAMMASRDTAPIDNANGGMRALNFTPGSEASLPKDFLRAWWDGSEIVVEPARVEGGKIVLFGDIFSTGNGLLKAVDGYGRINIDNQTSYAMRLGRMDTGNNIEGMIRITNTRPDLRYSAGVTGPVTTTITRLGSDINVLNTYVNAAQQEVVISETLAAASGRNYSYQPDEDRRFHWVNGQRTRERENRIYTTTYLFEADILAPDYNNPDQTLPPTYYYTPRVSGDYLANEPSLTQDYYYDYSKSTGSWYRWKDDTYTTVGTVCVLGVCAYKEVTHTAYYERWISETYNHSIAADKTINIEFTGEDTGALTLNSLGRIDLNDRVRNLTGTTTINAGQGLHSLNSGVSIQANNLTLAGGTGAIQGDPTLNPGYLDIDLVGGQLTATAQGDIRLREKLGDLQINRLVSGTGDIDLSADGNISGQGAVDNHLVGSAITLHSDYGQVTGNGANGALLINSANKVSVDAAGNIVLQETSGDLLADRIASRGGDVTIDVAAGNLLDGNGDEVIDLAAEQALLRSVGEQFGLLAGTTAASDRAAEAVASYERKIERTYQDYWYKVRNLTRNSDGSFSADAYDPNVSFSFSGAEASALANSGWSSADIAAYEQDMTDRYRAFGAGGASYNTAYSYTATATEQTSLTEGVAWTENQLTKSLPAGLFVKTVTDTEVRIEDPNIKGRNISLTASGRIGTLGSDVIIAGGTQASALTNEQLLALAAAEREDVIVDLANNQVRVSQKEDVDIDAILNGTVAATAAGDVYLGSEKSVALTGINSGGGVRLKANGAVTNADPASAAAVITAASAIVESASRGVGTAASPLRLDLSGGSIASRAAQGIYLTELTGDMRVENIYSRGLVSLMLTSGSLLDANSDLQTDIRGNGMLLNVSGNIGSSALLEGYLDVTVEPGSLLQALNAQSIALMGTERDLRLDAISAAGDLKVVTTVGNLELLKSVTAVDDLWLDAAQTLSFADVASASTSDGNLMLTADTLLMTDGAFAQTTTGTLAVTTTGDAIVTGLSSGNGTASALSVLSGGRILDGGDTRVDISATASGARLILEGDAGIGNATVTSGGIVATPNALEIDAVLLNAQSSAGSVYLGAATTMAVEEVMAAEDLQLAVSGDLQADTLSSGGSMSVEVTGTALEANTISAPETVRLAVLGEGGTLAVDEVQVGDQLVINADVVALPQVIHSPVTSDLNIDLSGNDGGVSEQVDLNVTSTGNVVYDQFKASSFDLNFGRGEVVLTNLMIAGEGVFTTPIHTVVVDNTNRMLHPDATAQLATFDGRPFDLTMTDSYLIYTDADIVHYLPNYIVNAFSTENSLTRLLQKRAALSTNSNNLFGEGRSLIEPILPGGMLRFTPTYSEPPFIELILPERESANDEDDEVLLIVGKR